MERAAYLEALAEAAAGLLAAARRADPDAGVPCCPEWTAADLVWHIGEVHDFWGHVVRDGKPPPAGRNRRPDTYAGLIEFAAATSTELQTRPRRRRSRRPGVELVRSRPDRRLGVAADDAGDGGAPRRRRARSTAATTASTWRSPPTASTSSSPTTCTTTSRARLGSPAACTSTAPTPTASGRSPPTATASPCTRDHAKADAALRGEANDLLMVLWRRLPLDAVTVFGDAALAAAFVDDSVTD